MTAAVVAAAVTAAAAVAVVGCRRDRGTRPRVPPRVQLTLAVSSPGIVDPALPALVRLVAEQELHRVGLLGHPEGVPLGALTLKVERRPGGTNRLGLHLLQATRALESRFDFGRCCAPAHVAELRRQVRVLLATVATSPPAPDPPLWPGSRFTRDRLRNTLAAGVHWLLQRAHRTGAFELSDLQQVFLILRESAQDPALRRLAARQGPPLARRFLRLAPTPRSTTPPAQLFDHAAGTYFARRFGLVPPDAYRRALATAFRDAPRHRMARRTAPADPARKLLDALVDLYFPYKLGLPLPEGYADVVTRAARYPFHFPADPKPSALEDRAYLATHVIYVLSDFNESALPESALRPVVRFLEQAGPVYLAADDVETLGELADALKIVGRGYDDPLLRRIVTRLLTRQNPDGSWGDPRDKDRYRRYHTTWTAFNGLLEYRFSRSGMADVTIRDAWRRGLAAPPSGPPAKTPPGPRPQPPRK